MSYFDDKLYNGDEDLDLDGGSSDDQSTSSSSSDENTNIRKKHTKSDLEDIENNDDEDMDIDDDDEDMDIDDDEDIDIDDDEDIDIEDDDTEKILGGDASNDGSDDGSNNDTKQKRVKKIPAKVSYVKSKLNSDSDSDDNDNDSDDDDDGEQYLQKFDKAINQNYIVNFHPESVIQNYDEISAMCKVIRDDDGVIIDDLHRTIPYLTKYEKARILGQRAKQINSGSPPFVKVPENVIDGYIIAELELKEKRIPFIIRRPLPNGGSEYWSIKDLEDISF